ncbi:MAG TPA: type II toxin-antitoxin system PemK/MazF family toxin [Bryobacteraceae bacterium]|jgi:mRNA interferase MazF|nr:type II toxin-antitoxin system PemK/MazF family toxin [Bryobacteraceae bacterium]
MPRRGEIWWVNLDPTVGAEIKKTRPCVVISNSVVNQHRRTVVIVPLSSSPNAAPPLLVSVQCSGQACVAVIDQVRAVSKDRLVRHIENLSTGHLQALEAGLREILELD